MFGICWSCIGSSCPAQRRSVQPPAAAVPSRCTPAAPSCLQGEPSWAGYRIFWAQSLVCRTGLEKADITDPRSNRCSLVRPASQLQQEDIFEWLPNLGLVQAVSLSSKENMSLCTQRQKLARPPGV